MKKPLTILIFIVGLIFIYIYLKGDSTQNIDLERSNEYLGPNTNQEFNPTRNVQN